MADGTPTMSRSVDLAPGISLTLNVDFSEGSIQQLRTLAAQLRHREVHGWLSEAPIQIEEGIDYVNRDVQCAYCGAQMPHAPWPTNSTSIFHRPRCGKCHSPSTFPISRCKEPDATLAAARAIPGPVRDGPLAP